MLNELEISLLQKKIEQIDDEIRVLKNGIEEEELYIGEVERCHDKLMNVRGNLLDILEKVFSKIGFIKSAEYLNSEMHTAVTGSSFEMAEDRILQTKKDLEQEKQKHKNSIEELKRMKQQYEETIDALRLSVMG